MLPLSVQSVRVAELEKQLYTPAPPLKPFNAAAQGDVAAEGAVGQRRRARLEVEHAAAAALAVLPLTVQLVSVAVP